MYPSRSGELAADEAVLPLSVEACASVGIQLTGTWTATVQFEGSLNGGDFVALNMVPSNSSTAATSATANGCWSGNCGGYSIVQVRISEYTSGTVRVWLRGASGSGK